MNNQQQPKGLFYDRCVLLSTLEQQNGNLTQIKIDEMLRLMGHVATKVSPYDDVPGRVEMARNSKLAAHRRAVPQHLKNLDALK